ncbi:MAG TPA: DUF433 domain-containing protein [Bryobacteraceae bacterium]|nr:DUF433 domain-containing protein [Bryobacteraceae bacterium]
MSGEYIEERNGGYYAAGTRISLDSVVCAFERGNSLEAIQEEEFPRLRLPQIYGAIAFYSDHRETIRGYLEAKEQALDESFIPLSQANPGLWARLERARHATSKLEP